MDDNRSWNDVGNQQRTLAQIDPHDVRPAMIGYSGPVRVALVELRPFESGAYHEPIIEALAALLTLFCDRISLAMPGRAWSLDDPIPPVAGDSDLRQRVLAETRVVDDGDDVEVVSVLHPFEITEDRIEWSDSIELPPAEGWITRTLEHAMRVRETLAKDLAEGEALERAILLGHQVAFDAALKVPGLPA